MFVCNLSAKEYVQAARYHKDSNENSIEKAKLLLQSKPFEITTGCSDLGKLIKKRGNAVLREVHLLSAYMRLKPYSEMVLVGECNPKHDTCYLITKSLARRFDKFVVIVFAESTFSVATNRRDLPTFPQFRSSSKNEVIINVREYAKETIKDNFPKDIFLEDGDFLWENYYETQFLEQRLNVKLFHKFIPKYALEKAHMKIEKKFYEKVVEQRKEKHTLDFFFD